MPDLSDIDSAIATLLLYAGVLMEDASAAAVSRPIDPEAAAQRVTALAATGAAIAALTACGCGTRCG